MELACYVTVALLISRAVVTSGSPAPTVQHPTSSQSFIIHQQPATSSSSSTSYGGGSPSAISGRFNEPKYEYKYEVSDHSTGDRKSHWETREGDKVRGVYTLYEPDGALRRVEYTADALHGFNAKVTRNGQTKHYPPTTPAPLYTGTNLIPTGYDKPGRQGFGPELAIPGQAPTRYSPGPPINPGLGFTVNHSKLNYPSVKRTDVIEPPY